MDYQQTHGISNSIIYGKQCTISWYVNENKVLHIDEEVKTEIIDTIAKHFGKLTVTRAKTKIPDDGNRLFRIQENISVHDILSKRINLIIRIRPRCNSIVTSKKRFT